MKLKINIARTVEGQYAAYTVQSPYFFFEHEDLKALLQCVDNTIAFYNEFDDEYNKYNEGPDYFFANELVEFKQIDLGTKS